MAHGSTPLLLCLIMIPAITMGFNNHVMKSYMQEQLVPHYLLPSVALQSGRNKGFFLTTTSRHQSTLPTDQDITNPSTKFGRPLSSEMSEFNEKTVSLTKDIIFDVFFAGEQDRTYARFYALETIARMPYFSYLSVLHLYETFGWWRKANYLKIHFAESWNELHHLLIMEELGGSRKFADRFVAQHIAFFYYWLVILFYLVNPVQAYNFNQHVEKHAFDTYDSYLNQYGEQLKELPAPQVAIDYYRDGDLYMFDEFQTSRGCHDQRRPIIENLYDVFVAIRDDEAEHVKTMTSLQSDMELSTSNDDICYVGSD